MEKCILRIKLKAPGTQISINNPPDRGNAALLIEDTAATDITSSAEEYIPESKRKNMRRKRGHKAYHKKGKKVKLVKDPSSDLVSVNTEDKFNLEQADDDQLGSEIDPEPPNGSNTPSILSNIDTEVPNDRLPETSGHGRVKVRLKSSRVSEPYRSSSDAHTLSETEKSNPQVTPNMIEAAAEKEESTYSDGQTSEMHNAVLEKIPRKTGSIKIKSSRGLGLSNEIMQERNPSKVVISSKMLSKKNSVIADTARTLDSSVPRNLRQRVDPRHSERELSAALAVIKKVMKMDAAGPFNTPVDPVALGIPDYFDIIDTPMDFGTIADNLEHGLKYMNSEDVFKDVQYIWDNCYKYNNKGDYVVDLMKRVKKNFTKYWLAAGLYSNIAGVPESTQIEDVSRSGQEKLYPKSKSKHKRRRYGIDQHKSDCLCAVCVVRRRRKEREENSAAIESQADASDSNIPRQLKLEECSPLDNPCSEDATSSLDHYPETDANADAEEGDDEEKLETPDRLLSLQLEKREMDTEMEFDHDENRGNNQSSQQFLENGNQVSKSQFRGQDRETTQPGVQKYDSILQNNESSTHHYPQMTEKQEESPERNQLVEMQESSVQQENHLVLRLCSSLFPSDLRSVWNGPHSLNRRNVSFRKSPINSALETFMKQ